jgi:hypothetical protein
MKRTRRRTSGTWSCTLVAQGRVRNTVARRSVVRIVVHLRSDRKGSGPPT